MSEGFKSRQQRQLPPPFRTREDSRNLCAESVGACQTPLPLEPLLFMEPCVDRDENLKAMANRFQRRVNDSPTGSYATSTAPGCYSDNNVTKHLSSCSSEVSFDNQPETNTNHAIAGQMTRHTDSLRMQYVEKILRHHLGEVAGKGQTGRGGEQSGGNAAKSGLTKTKESTAKACVGSTIVFHSFLQLCGVGPDKTKEIGGSLLNGLYKTITINEGKDQKDLIKPHLEQHRELAQRSNNPKHVAPMSILQDEVFRQRREELSYNALISLFDSLRKYYESTNDRIGLDFLTSRRFLSQ